MFFINAFHWLWLFIVPAGILVSGVAFAEYVRRKYGLDNFFGRLMATPDIDGGNVMDEKPGIKKEVSKGHDKTQK